MLTQIAQQFSDSVLVVEPLGNGHINDTYKVETDDKPFVLQRINAKVFPQPELIMANLQVLSRHAASQENLNTHLKIPLLYSTKTGDIAYQDDDGNYWRAWEYIANTDCFEVITSPNQAHAVGKALGQFHRLLSAINPNDLHDTLPGFHITPSYYQTYLAVLADTQVKQDQYCAEFIDSFSDKVSELETAKAQGLLTEKVIHGDPKLNNFLFDKDTGQVISLIDLDTVKPGLIHYDIGDCLRSCCHKLEDNSFDLEICRVILQGYLGVMADCLTANDFAYLYPAIRLIPFELGLRFYTDFLDGNRYFKVNDSQQNRHRAIEQFKLCESIQAKEKEILRIIDSSRMNSGH